MPQLTSRRFTGLIQAVLIVCLAGSGPAFAQHAGHGEGTERPEANRPYAGQQAREIKSLSADDLDELRRGAGWGLARAAELNGVPGPAHLLELSDELALDEQQIAAITTVRDRMREEAGAAGERFIAAERALDEAFAAGVPEPEELERLTREAGEARAALRLVHLAAQLETPDLISPVQTERYNVLRGYTPDPCANVPKGHNAEMWKRHNNC